MKYNIQFITVLMFLTTLLRSQSNSEKSVPPIQIKYNIIGKVYKDSIVLRFAPTSPNALPAHIESGVTIEQMVVKGKYPYKLSKWERINQVPIKPASIQSFNNETAKQNNHMMLVAQALYGNIPSTKVNDEIGKVKEQAEALENLFYLSLLSADYNVAAANSYGLRYTLKTKINSDEKLFFRIYSNFNHPLFRIDTSMTFVTYGEAGVDDSPKFLSIQNKEKAIQLKLPVNKELHRWSGFNIEKSEDGINFSRVNKKPYMEFRKDTKYDMLYTDSLTQNYKKYYYRIQAIDPFGDVTGYTEAVEGMGIDITPPGTLTLKEESNKGNGIYLKWNFIEKQSSDLDHFLIKKGKDINQIDEIVKKVTKNTYEYYYSDKASTRSTYFEIIAVDTAGNISHSNPVRYFAPDTIPPLSPQLVKASIDTNGIVTVKWPLDTLDELIGYRVYRKNQIDHKFVCLQQGYLPDTIFFDTLELKTLTREVYYAVAAIDISYNHSKLSETIMLSKPDKVAPYPPNIVDYKVTDGNVFFKWTPSPSEDVEYYNIIRKDINNNTENVVAMKIPANTLSYNDEGHKSFNLYEYSIIAIDKTGLVSKPSFPLNVKTYTNKIIEDIKVEQLIEDKSIGLKWSSPSKKPVYYIIYKDSGSGLIQYANAKAEDTYFKENKKGGNEIYALQAVFENQTKSEIFTINK